MTEKIADQVRGKTIRLSWTDGPTKGTTHEHVFHADGTVDWHSVDGEEKEKAQTGGAQQAAPKPERPKYAAFAVSDDVCLVSYLSTSGYTLTVILRFTDGSTVGFASNDKTWFPVQGTFEVMD